MNGSKKLDDKAIELNRYDNRAKTLLSENIKSFKLGSSAMPLVLRKPYLVYEEKINKLVNSSHKILEIGSGVGTHTAVLVQTGAQVVATDISPNSLEVLKKNINHMLKKNNLITKVCDMEKLPFIDKSFDIVACAGSLSYGNSDYVYKEIRRVLKSNGLFICVDSLNNSYIYKFNRYIQYLMNKRSLMTISNMPSIKKLNLIASMYNEHKIRYFGSISFLMPILTKLFNKKKMADFSDIFDAKFKIKQSAFKFVLIAKV